MALLLALALLSQAKADVVAKLDTRVSVDWKGADLSQALDYLRSATGLKFHVEVDDDPYVTFAGKDLPARTVLKLALRSAGLGAVYRDGVLVVRKQGDVRGARTLELYDVRALLVRMQDFPGPRVELRPQGRLMRIG
jgi:hypothetical protein